MVKLKRLSPNLVILLNEIISSQNVCKYLYYNQSNCLSQPDLSLPAKELMFDKIFPYPFNPNVTTEDGVQLRVYYPYGQFEVNSKIEDTIVFFDIIISKSQAIWLTVDSNNNSTIRPYELMSELINHLADRSIKTVGVLDFLDFKHLSINDKFDAIRIEAKMFTIG